MELLLALFKIDCSKPRSLTSELNCCRIPLCVSMHNAIFYIVFCTVGDSLSEVRNTWKQGATSLAHQTSEEDKFFHDALNAIRRSLWEDDHSLLSLDNLCDIATELMSCMVADSEDEDLKLCLKSVITKDLCVRPFDFSITLPVSILINSFVMSLRIFA